jgi:rhodanese-related sulfurtransferase
MKLRSFLGVILTVVLLSIGLVSISGCATTPTQTTAAIQPTSETPVVQPTLGTTVTTPASVVMAAIITPTTETPVVQPAPVIMTVTTPAPVVTTVTTPITVTPVTTPTTTTESQQLLLAAIRSTAEQPYGGVYYVDAVTAKSLVDNTQAIFLDARYLVDYNTAHVYGAISLPVSSVWAGTIDPETVLLDKNAVLIAYCAPGCPAGLELAEELYVLGYQNVFVLDGGYLVWQDAGYAMVTQ